MMRRMKLKRLNTLFLFMVVQSEMGDHANGVEPPAISHSCKFRAKNVSAKPTFDL